MCKIIVLFVSFCPIGIVQANQGMTAQSASSSEPKCGTVVRSTGFLAHSEQILSKATTLAVACVFKGCSFTLKYPRVSCTIIALVPWILPGSRRRMLGQCSGLVRYAVHSLGEYIHNRMSLWLVGSLPDQVERTESMLEQVAVSLEELKDMQEKYGQQLRTMQETEDEQGKQLQDILQQLESLKGEVSQGNMDILARMTILEQRYSTLSEEQKKLLADYGIQFGTRLDQLAEGMCLLLRQTGATPGASCSRQALLKLS